MKSPIALFLLLIAYLIIPISAFSIEDSTVLVEGYGNTRDEALLDARREAVAQGVGVLLTSETEVNNFILQKDVVLTKIMGSVKNVTILEERKRDKDTYYVKIKAVISEESIKRDLMALQILLSSMDYPRILVLLKDDQNNQASVTVSDYFLSKGFPVVDPSTVLSHSGVDEIALAKILNGSPGSVAQIGKKNGADFVVTGTVEATAVNGDFVTSTGLQSYRTTIIARIINCQSGRVLASKSAGSSAAHLSPESARATATAKAAEKLMDQKLFDQLIGAFQHSVNNGFSLQVTVTNVSSYALQKEIRSFIKNLNTISMQKRRFANQQLDLEVVYKFNSDNFCDTIEGTVVAGNSIQVTECNSGTVSLNLLPFK